jgi:hypothetical protein
MSLSFRSLILALLMEVLVADVPSFPRTIAFGEQKMSGSEQQFSPLIEKYNEVLKVLSAKSDRVFFSQGQEWGPVIRGVFVTPDGNGGWSPPSTLIIWREAEDNKVMFLVDDAGPVPTAQ